MNGIKNYNALCLSSGGVYGSYMIGILHHITTFYDLSRIKYYIGTSIGSIICLLLIIGYTPLEILTYICTNDTNKFLDFSLSNIMEGYGIYDINNIKNYFSKMIEDKIGFMPTFKELFEITDKYFLCTSYCVNKKQKVYFSVLDTPSISIIDGIMSSCAVPFVLTKYEFDKNLYTDGAVFNHFPVLKLLDFIENFENINNIRVLCIKLNTENINDIKNYLEYILSVLVIMIDTQEKEQDKKRIDDLLKKNILDIVEINRDDMFISDNVSIRIKYFCKGVELAKNYYSKKKLKLD